MTIAEIARMAGVSNAAVSRYFNNGYISGKKREAIRRVVEETGYRPSLQAQTLRTRKTKLIGVIAPKMASTAIGRIVEGILSVLNESGYQMLLAVTENDPEKELTYLRTFREKQVDGVILLATVFTKEHKKVLSEMNVPLVIAGQRLSGYTCVYHDDRQGTADLTKRLLALGRRQLCYLGALPEDEAVGAERLRGYQETVRKAGLNELAQRTGVAGFSVKSGYEQAKALYRAYPSMDCLICATDEIALGAARYLRETGVKVPEQVLVAGHDDSLIAQMMVPPMPTVHFFYETCGSQAVRMLFEQMNEPETPAREVRLACEPVMGGAGPDPEKLSGRQGIGEEGERTTGSV